jgi:hypothetical protein
MRICLFIMFLTTAFDPLAFAQAHDDWYRCKTARDCAIITGGCGVEWAANKNFIELTRKNPPRPDGPCKKPIEIHPAKTFAYCADNKCDLYPSGTFAGGTSISKDSCIISGCWGHLGCNNINCTRSDGSKYTKFAQ